MVTDELHLVFDPVGEHRAAARECEFTVFAERYGMSRERMEAEYDPYDDVSVWVAVLDAADDVIAGCRLIPPNGRGFKSLDDIAGAPWSLDAAAVVRASGLDLQRTWDVATMFRLPSHRTAPVTAALCHAIVQSIRYNHGTAFVAILDHVVRALLERWFALRVRTLPGASRQVFMNTPNDPTYTFLSDMLDNSRRVSPEGYRMYVRGDGLEGIDLPGPDGFRLRRSVVDVRETATRPAAGPPTLPQQRSGHDHAAWPG